MSRCVLVILLAAVLIGTTIGCSSSSSSGSGEPKKLEGYRIPKQAGGKNLPPPEEQK